jgi:hypothetical protein
MTDPDLFSKILKFVKHEEELVKAAEEVTEEDEELDDKRDPKEVVDDFSESVSYDYDASEEPYISFGVSGLLASTQKLLNVNKGIDTTDFRDALKFKKMFPVNKQISERIRNDRTGVRKKLLAAASYRKNLSFLTPFYFDSYGEKQLIGNQLSSPLEEINPIHLLENARRTTQLGEGGIQSSDSITEDMQAVHPGQFGFLSGLEGPECFPPDTEVLTSEGWVQFKDVTKDHEFCCLGSGFHRHFSKPYAIIESAFKGNLIKFTDAKGGELLVTPNHRIYHTINNDRFAHDVRIYLAKELKSAKFYTFTELYLEAGIALSVMHVDKAEEVPYDGEVYCASVPGSSVLVRTPQGSTWWTGNSERIGVDARLTKGVKIGSDGRLYQLFLNKKTGNYEYLNPEQVANRIVKLPD